MKLRKATFVAPVALTLIVAAAYSRVWHGGVLWDDDGHLTSAALRAPGGLWRIWFDVGATQQYYPLVHSTFWIMDRLWGADTLGYHLVNIALHATSAWMLAVVLRRLSIPGAWLAAVIFALHPVHVESVAWMTELKNTLSGALYLAAALAYLRFDERRSTGAYIGALVLFVLALLSKTVVATLPAGLLVIFWWQRGRIDWRRDVQPLIPFFALGLFSGVATAWVERTFIIGPGGPDFHLTLVERVLVAGRALFFYLGHLLWPANLVFVYPRWTVSGAVPWQYLFPIAAIALTVALWRVRGRTRAPLAAWLFFAGTLVPALGFVDVYPFRYSFVADHFQYLASLGVIVFVAASIVTVLQRFRPAVLVEAVACGVVAVPLAAVTWHQTRIYVDADTLYRSTLAENPSCWMAYSNLATLALARTPPDLEAALANVQASLRIVASDPVSHNNLGVILQRLGRFEEAEREHREAMRLNPHYPEAVNHLGVAVAALGRGDEAVEHYREALRLDPRFSGASRNLGLALLDRARPDEAMSVLRQSLALDATDAEAHDSLGTALRQAGRIDEAVAEYREAVRLRPDFGKAHQNLGSALFRLGQLDAAAEALSAAMRLMPNAGVPHDTLGSVRLRQNRREDAAREFLEAVRLQPDYGPAHEHLGEMLHDEGRLEEAMAEYQRALTCDPGLAEAHNNLGVLLASLGRYTEAVTHFSSALRINPNFTEARENLARARGK